MFKNIGRGLAVVWLVTLNVLSKLGRNVSYDKPPILWYNININSTKKDQRKKAYFHIITIVALGKIQNIVYYIDLPSPRDFRLNIIL